MHFIPDAVCKSPCEECSSDIAFFSSSPPTASKALPKIKGNLSITTKYRLAKPTTFTINKGGVSKWKRTS